MEKRAEMTNEQIIYLVLAIVGFAILLIVYLYFGWESLTDKEICHKSIVERSSFNLGPLEVAKAVIPLNCKTEKICLKKGTKDCKEVVKGTEIDISGKTAAEKNEKVLDALSDALYDCHTMLGEGKLDFMPHEGGAKRSCLICAMIFLNDDAKADSEIKKDVSFLELYQNMQRKQTPEGKSYLEVVYNAKSLAQIVPVLDQAKEAYNNNPNKPPATPIINNIREIKMNLMYDRGNVVLAAMTPYDTNRATLTGVLVGAAVVVATLTTGVGGIVIATIAGAGAGGYMYATNYPSGQFSYFAPTILPYEPTVLENCNSFETSK